MLYRKLSANFIFSSKKGFIKNGILLLDRDNRIIDLIDSGGDLKEESNLEYYNGILAPGFVNAFSVLELSYLRGQISGSKMMTNFIGQVPNNDRIMVDQVMRSLEHNDEIMRREGIIAAAFVSLINASTALKIMLPFNSFCQNGNVEKSIKKSKEIYLVICAKSSYFIEGQHFWPRELKFSKDNICLGTGSLASDDRLSILDEMLFIQENNDQINLDDLLRWATINGAKALAIDSVAGSFEKGKQPGVNLIENADLQRLKLTHASRVKVLIS